MIAQRARVGIAVSHQLALGRQRGERGVTVIGSAAPVEAISLDPAIEGRVGHVRDADVLLETLTAAIVSRP